MSSHYQFENYKKVFVIYVALATKRHNYKKKAKLQKKVFMIYVIHVGLDVALMLSLIHI